jgi:tetratricopeptide (TPR) repeat protein
MEFKDLLTLAISLSAFLLSLIATTISLRNRAQEEERTLRSLLNDVVSKIHGARIDQAKYRADNQGREGKEQNIDSAITLFNYQINSLARLAVYITAKIEKSVTDIEFATIASAFAWTGDQHKATQYWESAISASKDKYSQIVNRRDYAHYLFTTGNVGEGRNQYIKALELSPVADDWSKHTTGYTYRMWGVNEHMTGNDVSAQDCFNKAAEAYRTISLERIRTFGLVDLERARQRASGAIPEPRPGEPPIGPTVPTVIRAP